MSFLRKQLLDIIQWEDSTQNTLVYKYPMRDNEIQNGGQLVVRPGQAAVFVNEGKVADVFGEGTHRLETQNLPILGNLKGWKFGFKSPFKSDVYFVSVKKFLNQKWGTPQPILITDPKFEQVEVRAFGTFGFVITDPESFIRNVSSTNKIYTVKEIEGQLKSFIITEFSQIVAKQNVTVAELSRNYGIINQSMEAEIANTFSSLGLRAINFTVNNINLPEEIRKALRERTNINILGDNYSNVRTLDVMENMSNREGGANDMANTGIGMGMGMGMAQMFNQNMQQQQQPQQPYFNPNQQGQPMPQNQPSGQHHIPCVKCQNHLDVNSKFCNHCGTKVETQPQPTNKFCTNCGTKNNDNAKFCNNCGHNMV